MLTKAREFLSAADEVVRIDVPGRGGGEEGSGSMRAEIETAIPVLQSASLFGGVSGLEFVDANQLNAAEATILAELVEKMDQTAVAMVVVSLGAVPTVLAKALKAHGQVEVIKKMRERDSQSWLVEEVRS
ncbi:MAG: hypothetical protein WD020_05560, partial [Acidimicrobiia bacterium]